MNQIERLQEEIASRILCKFLIPVFLISVWFVYCISAVNIILVSSDSCTCAAVTEPEVCNLAESLVDSVQEFLVIAFKLWHKELFFWQFCRKLFLCLEMTLELFVVAFNHVRSVDAASYFTWKIIEGEPDYHQSNLLFNFDYYHCQLTSLLYLIDKTKGAVMFSVYRHRKKSNSRDSLKNNLVRVYI